MSAERMPDRDGPIDVALDGRSLDWELLDAVYEHPVRVAIAESQWQRVRDARARIERLLESNEAYYGINTGFGPLCRTRIPPDQLVRLQENLVISHAVGLGEPAPDAIVRWMMLFKIHALLAGYSGASEAVVRALAAMLNADLLPVVPTRGSLGASGDLAPLAHMAKPLLGLGQVRRGRQVVEAAEALAAAGVEPVRLGPKDGLALLNGTQFMSAYAAATVVRARRLARQADAIASMSLEGLMGSARPFDARLHEIRPHPGAISVARNFRALLADSEILPAHAHCEEVQDPYSLRCIPQVHGAARDAVEHLAEVTLREINGVTDNPIVFDDGDVISGGNFHGEPLALTQDYAAAALAELASISERRIYLLLDGRQGLPALLMKDTGVNSGFMLVQYAAAALVSENKVLAHPASVDSIPTSMGQEDHVSMGATAAIKCRQILENAETVLAVELLCAAQALDFRAPLKAGCGPRLCHELVRQRIPHAYADRDFGSDIANCLDLIREQSLCRSINETGISLA
jgi:histidine ammonia-lyase